MNALSDAFRKLCRVLEDPVRLSLCLHSDCVDCGQQASGVGQIQSLNEAMLIGVRSSSTADDSLLSDGVEQAGEKV